MRLIFRADASQEIGSGHVLRCSAIAEAAISRGIQSILVGSIIDLDWVNTRLMEIGMGIESPQSYLNQRNFESDILVIDSYDLKISDEFISPKYWKRVVALVDEVTPDYFAHLIIHPGIDASWFKKESRNFLWGSDYIPLRGDIKKLNSRVNPKVRKILVSGGGTDVFGFGFAVAKELRQFVNFEEAIYFASRLSEIEDLDPRFKGVAFGKNFDKEMESADIVITTASTSSLEVLAREIPLGVGCAVANQESYYKVLTELKVAVPIGTHIGNNEWGLDINILSDLINNFELRQSLLNSAHQFIGLEGSDNIVTAILAI
jgi:spore coat polysaccharide biosynthesis predicted glycosyltransferase SpsG